MDHGQHNRNVNFIWSIADDELRDVYVRGRYRELILPMVVLRRLDAPALARENQSQRILTSPSTCLNSLSPVTSSDLRSFASAAAKQSA